MFLFIDILFLLKKVLSIECFEKIRHGQKIFPLKSLKGFKCIYNELERKSSLPIIEQKRAISSLPNARKTNFTPAPTAPANTNNANTTKQIPRQQDQPISSYQKSTISHPIRPIEERQHFHQRETSPTSLKVNNPPSSENDPMVMKYQSIQRYRSNFEILKPATVTAEDWDSLDQTQRNRLSIGGSKTLVLISKCSAPNKTIPPLDT